MNPREGRTPTPFEVQFLQREKFGEREINVLDISPPNPTGTLYFALGWNCDINDYEVPIEQIYRSGNRIISAELSGAEEQKAKDMASILASKNVKKANIVAHSVGAISTVMAVAENENLASKVVLVNPASMIGEDSVPSIIRRYKTVMKQEPGTRGQEERERVSLESFKNMARTITGFDMYSYLEMLEKKGIDFKTFHANNDLLFPAPRVSVEVAKREWKHKISFFNGQHLTVGELIPDILKYFES